MAERRERERVSWSGRVKISEPLSKKVISTQARVRNVSPRGFSFVTDNTVRRSVTYRFEMDLTDTKVDIEGTIVHLRTEATYALCGVRFTNLNFVQRGRLNRFVAARSPKTRKVFRMKAAGVALVAAVLTYFMVTLNVYFVVAVAGGVFLLFALLVPF